MFKLLIAAAFGAGQAVLLQRMFVEVQSGERKQAFKTALIKISLYAVCILIAVAFFFSSFITFLGGYIAAFSVTGIIIFIYHIYKK